MRCGMTSRFLVVHPWLRFCCNQGLDCAGAEGTARKEHRNGISPLPIGIRSSFRVLLFHLAITMLVFYRSVSDFATLLNRFGVLDFLFHSFILYGAEKSSFSPRCFSAGMCSNFLNLYHPKWWNCRTCEKSIHVFVRPLQESRYQVSKCESFSFFSFMWSGFLVTDWKKMITLWGSGWIHSFPTLCGPRVHQKLTFPLRPVNFFEKSMVWSLRIHPARRGWVFVCNLCALWDSNILR